MEILSAERQWTLRCAPRGIGNSEQDRERGKGGISTFTDEKVNLFFQKSKPLKKIFTMKESVFSGSQQLKAAEVS